jgi:hypothetical protein
MNSGTLATERLVHHFLARLTVADEGIVPDDFDFAAVAAYVESKRATA